MKIAACLLLAASIFILASATAIPQDLSALERARTVCDTLPPGRREACLRSLPHPRVPPLADWKHIGIGPRDVEHDGPRHKLPDHPTDGSPYYETGSDKAERDVEHSMPPHKMPNHPTDGSPYYQTGKDKSKRNIEVTALEHGAIDLAIPVPAPAPPAASGPYDWTAEPTPTTLITQTVTTTISLSSTISVSTTPTPTLSPTTTTATNNHHLNAITIANDISLLPTTTYPVEYRTLQTATLANGTEIRIEQTESQVHDVHVEETERREGEPEEDRVVVHVKVFVEHVREKVAGLVRRGWEGLGAR